MKGELFMGAMKNLYVNFVDRIVNETGYDFEDVANRVNDALGRGAKPIDIFDDIVDSYCFGEG